MRTKEDKNTKELGNGAGQWKEGRKEGEKEKGKKGRKEKEEGRSILT